MEQDNKLGQVDVFRYQTRGQGCWDQVYLVCSWKVYVFSASR